MRFRLRTLLILMAIGPPIIAVAWHRYTSAPLDYDVWLDPLTGRRFSLPASRECSQVEVALLTVDEAAGLPESEL